MDKSMDEGQIEDADQPLPGDVSAAQRTIQLATFIGRWASMRTEYDVPHSLTYIQLQALYLIRYGVVNPGSLARGMLVTPTVVSSILNRLEDHGYVQRTVDPTDRRRIIVQATESGQEIGESAERLILEPLAREIHALDSHERERLQEGLDVIEHMLLRLDADATWENFKAASDNGQR